MNMRTRVLISATASLVALTAAAPAWSQAAGESPETEATVGEDVVVIGTNIRGAHVIGSAVETVSAEDIKKSGKGTLAELMREMPINFAGGVGNPDNNRGQTTSSHGANLASGSGINLRGLGALSTLVLVNGRRVALSGQYGDFVDIANIPVAAIERMEILQDGGSGVYGSDAVGGVVNIILKRKVDGINALARVGTTTEGGGTEYQGSLTGGKSWGSGNIVIGYEYHKRENVLGSQRGLNGDLSSRGGINWPLYTNRAGAAANIFSGNPSFNANVAYTVPQGANSQLTIANLVPVTNGIGNTFDQWAGVDILPAMERHSVFLSFDQHVNDAVSIYGDARYTSRDTLSNIGIGSSYFYGAVPTTNPSYIPGVSNNFGVVIDDRPLIREGTVRSVALNGGVRFDMFGDWQGDAALSYSREKQGRYSTIFREGNVHERLPSGAFAPNSITCSLMGLNASNIASVVSPTESQLFCASLGYAAWNPYSTQALPSNVVDQLIGYEDLTFNSQVIQGTAKFDGTLLTLPGGKLKLAMGVDYRREKINGVLDFNHRSIQPYVVEYGTTAQEVMSMFAEASIPLVGDGNSMPGIAALEFSAAVRHEASSSTTVREFETTNPKFGFRYAPFEGFNIRGSWGTSFHVAPMRYQYNGLQPVGGGNVVFYSNNAFTAPCNTNLVTLNGFTGTPGSATGNCTFTTMIVNGGAGPILEPETAKTWTLGLDFAPPSLRGLRVGVNYFNITIDNRLIALTRDVLTGVLSNYFSTGTSPFINSLSFNPDDAVVTALMNDPRYLGLQSAGPQRSASAIDAIFYLTQTNLAQLKTQGIDLSLNFAFEAGDLGTFELFGKGTLFTSYKIKANPSAAFVDKLGVYEPTGNPVKFRSRQGMNWSKGPVDLSFAANYVDGYACVSGCYVPSATGAPVLNTAPVKIASWLTFDLQLGADLSGLGGALRDTRLIFSALNLFNRDAPFVDLGRPVLGNAAERYDTTNSTIIGRSVSLTLTKNF